jgi:hypothetical protein
MKKLVMTLCGTVFSLAVFAQQSDSTDNGNDYNSNIGTQSPAIMQPRDSQLMNNSPQIQEQQQTSPIIQQQFNTQPQLQSQPRIQAQPGIRLQPLQTNPQIPSQTQPLDLNSPAQQNQFNKPAQHVPTEQGAQRPG